MIRVHGQAPYSCAVIHGGPGAIGSLRCVAEELAQYTGVLEPLQSKMSIDELIGELHEQITSHVNYPVTLVGHSWGAWLSTLYTAQNPQFVKMLVLVGSAPFVQVDAKAFEERRMKNLSDIEKKEFNEILAELNNPQINEQNDQLLLRLGMLSDKADSYCANIAQEHNIKVDGEMFRKVWSEASHLRRTGKLIQSLHLIKVPIVIIHGTHDPHPLEDVVEPLKKAGHNPIVHVLDKCGHCPFRELYAQKRFYSVISQLLTR